MTVPSTQTANKEVVMARRNTVKPYLRAKTPSTHSNVFPDYRTPRNARIPINVRARCARSTLTRTTSATPVSQTYRTAPSTTAEKERPTAMTKPSTAASLTSPAEPKSEMARSAPITITCASPIFAMMRLISALVAELTRIAKALHRYVIKEFARNPAMSDQLAPLIQTVLQIIVLQESVETTKQMVQSATPNWNAHRIFVITRLVEVSSRERPRPLTEQKTICLCILDSEF